jgi:hypothetical protein
MGRPPGRLVAGPQNQYEGVSQPQVESLQKRQVGVAKRRVCTIWRRPGSGPWPLGLPLLRGFSLRTLRLIRISNFAA